MYALLPKVPKHIAFKAISDIRIRRQWDSIAKDMTIVEEDIDKETFIVRYIIPTPPFIQTREAVVQKKVLRDFPQPGQWAVVHKSVQHPDWPEDPTRYVRILQKMGGMVFEDAPEINGTKLTWIV
jgi:hypothetical protein